MSHAFSDIRILDLSTNLSGAFAARFFGDFGAEVILAESETGHTLRKSKVLHAYANWNKKSIQLHDDDELDSLIKSSDIIITTPSDVLRLPYDAGCGTECWSFSIEEGGSDWIKTATVKFTLETAVVTGVYNVKISVVNSVSATKDFSV